MALSFLASAASKMLSSGKKGDSKVNEKKKKISSEKLLPPSGGGIGGGTGASVGSPNSSLVPYKPKISRKKISTEDIIKQDPGESDSSEYQNLIDEVKKLKLGVTNVRDLLEKKLFADLEFIAENKKKQEQLKKKKRESELEKKKEPKSTGKGKIPKPKIGFLDSIINFFTNVLLGSIVNLLLQNKDTIFKMFDDISKGFSNILDAVRYTVISLTTTMPKLVKGIASLSKRLLKGPANLTQKLLKRLGTQVKNLLVNVGKTTAGFVKNQLNRVSNAVGGAGSAVTRSTGVGIRRVATNNIRRFAKPVARATAPIRQTSQMVLQKAGEKLFKPGGLKHFKKVSAVFKKIPFIGALIGIGIDLAMGERLDNALAGAAGASLGAAIGGAIGTGLIPIPGLGTFLGGAVGAAVGDWAGKEIYKKLSGQISQINPTEQLLQSSAYSLPSSQHQGPLMPGIEPASVNFGAAGVQAAIKYAQSKGYGKALTAGMLSTILNESSFNPYAVGDNGNSYGLFQFNDAADRRKPFLDFLTASGIPNPQALFTNTSNPDRAKYKDQVFGLTVAYMMEREMGTQLVRDYKNSNDLRTIMGAWEDVERYSGSQTRLPRNQRNNPKFNDRFAEAQGYLKNLDPNYKPSSTPQPSQLRAGQPQPHGGHQLGHPLPPQQRIQGRSAAVSALSQRASYEAAPGGPIVVMAPMQSSAPMGPMGSGGPSIIPVGMSVKDALNSYYKAQLLGTLYKIG